MNKLKNFNEKILSKGHFILKKVSFDYKNLNNEWEHQEREIFDRGHGAVVLLYNQQQQSIILTEQFRMPVYMTEKEDAVMMEACAGMLDDNDPKTAIIKEIEEETGYRLKEDQITKIYKAYSSPGAVTEILHYFVAPYTRAQKVSGGGGSAEETENIIVHEMPFAKAIQLLSDGTIKDAKTIVLLQYAQLHIF
ncbi:NUDIX domain-containing protein [Flavimarina sp. Hel_I_48]|uniref:NUDIX domain-containing protein n=1 Tax=Flavimarina sp. Hel_I_48 TaxID=1392488 RepID=UPI0004DF61E5|nr:NUDIX domain-containing protein [Flavimarina sp. Hel_I_48]